MGKYDVGNIFKTNEGYDVVIIEKHVGKSKIKFLDNYGYEVIKDNSQISEGSIKNNYHKSVFGIGYIGSYNGDLPVNKLKSRVIWKSMLERCYCDKYQKRFPCYVGVNVCEEWLDFGVFDKWFNKNYVEGFKLDKDLLQENIANKIYSPSTCIFIPPFINSFISNIYKTNTSGYIGVSWNKPSKQWMATIRDLDKGVNVNLGRYDDIEDAKNAYIQARKINTEKVKDRARLETNLPEHIIQLIK